MFFIFNFANSCIKSLQSIDLNNSDSIVKRVKDDNRSSNIVALYIIFILFSTENDLSASQFAIGVVTNNLYAMYMFGKISIICRSTKELEVMELRQYVWYNISNEDRVS